MSEEVKNRRPIKSRNTKWATRAASWLQRKGATPNDISLCSLICAEVAGIAFLLTFRVDNIWLSSLCLVVAAIGIQGRLVCNLLDGMVAVEGGLKSALGPVFNELPDRLSDIIIFICIGYGLWMFEWSVYIALAAALFSVMTAYVRLLGGTCGLEQQFLGPMAKQQRMALLTIGCILAIIIPPYSSWIIYICLWYIAIGAFITTVWRTYHIMIMLSKQNKTYRDIRNDSTISSENFTHITSDKL